MAADGTKLEVSLYTSDSLEEGEEAVTLDVDFVSYIAPSTYGPPPLIAPAKNEREARAQVGDEVLYISTSGVVPAWKIKRIQDHD